ncbi:MAG: iron-sulfur cluster repair di-iron protein [Acidobacteriota bacterium]|nr:iron-sulfur cluster repair di-iron protein [Acidobacteriota bacterium]
MTVTVKTVRDVALEQPTSIRVFEQYGIDYCCGGRKPLAEACASSNLEVDAVLAALEVAAQVPLRGEEDWAHASLESLIRHIVVTHHAYVRSELPRLAVLAEKVVHRHGDTQSELPLIQTMLAQLDEELSQHLTKEETVLFPYVAKLEQAKDGITKPQGGFGNVANPIAMMTAEHDAAGALLAEIRQLSHQFVTPVGACPTYHAFYDGLKEFEQGLHQHIHLENNILFPGAIRLESGTPAESQV